MILFGPPEFTSLGYLCYYGIAPFVRSIELSNLFFSFLLLLRILPENSRTVLAAEIRALPIQRGRVMQGEKRIE